jgi:hypothetical protein
MFSCNPHTLQNPKGLQNIAGGKARVFCGRRRRLASPSNTIRPDGRKNLWQI